MIPLRGAATRGNWPFITLGLIALNVLIFFYTLHIGPQATLNLFFKGGAVPAKLSQLKLLTSKQSLWLLATMFISLFLHAGWVHLIGNMWFLWVFGEALEDDLGHGRFLAFYLFAGFFACLFHVLASSRLSAPLIGASGAIAGVMGGYLMRLPQSPILTLVFWRLRFETIYVPAFVWLIFWVGLQFYGLRQGGPIAWMAHLGGFFTGLLAVSLFTPLKPATAKANPRKGRAKSKGKPKKKSK
jgi:membrane associated rhomboid family serine protease